MKERGLILLVIAAYAILEIWTLIPDGKYISPFPFSDVELNVQTYVWMACIKISFMLFAYVLFQYSHLYEQFFTVLFYFALFELIEYFLNYNEPWFRVYRVPVDVTSIRYTVLLFMAYRIWRTQTR